MNKREKLFQFDCFKKQAVEMLYGMDDRLERLKECDSNSINQIYRIFHSLRSASSMTGCLSVSYLSHQLEIILLLIRKEELFASEEVYCLVKKGYKLLFGMLRCEDVGESLDLSAIFEEASLLLSYERGKICDLEQKNTDCIKQLLVKSNNVFKIEERMFFSEFIVFKGYLDRKSIAKALQVLAEYNVFNIQKVLGDVLDEENCAHVSNLSRFYMLHPLSIAKELNLVDENFNISDISKRKSSLGDVLYELQYCNRETLTIWLHEFYDYCTGRKLSGYITENMNMQKRRDYVYSKNKVEKSSSIKIVDNGIVEKPKPKNLPLKKSKESKKNDDANINETDNALPFKIQVISCDDSQLSDFNQHASKELYNSIEDMLIKLEGELESGVRDELLQLIFRTMHSLKGSSGFVGAKGCGYIVHQLEDVLTMINRAPAGIEQELWGSIVNVFLRGIDVFWGMKEAVVNERDEALFISAERVKIESLLQDIQKSKLQVNDAVKDIINNEDIDDLF